ncbi:MAG: OsmC family protein [Steroidobacteraceae bacterium]
MSIYTVEVVWERGDQDFLDRRYSRRHLIRFDGGAQLVGSSSPAVVPVPQSDAAGVDPEEAFVASLSGCHMLWFLDIAARQGLLVDRYEDRPSGVLERNAMGRHAMTRVTLRPRVQFAGAEAPAAEQLAALHSQAHEHCYIANSVTTAVTVEPAPDS